MVGAVLSFLLFVFVFYWVAVVFSVILFLRGLWHIFSGRIILGLIWTVVSCFMGFVEYQLMDAWQHPPAEVEGQVTSSTIKPYDPSYLSKPAWVAGKGWQ